MYHDVAIAIDADRNLYNGQPSLVARWLDELAIAPGDHVLHIGCGSGYFTSVIAHVVGPSGRVDAIDIDAELAVRARVSLSDQPWVHVRHSNGTNGLPSGVDAVVVHAGATHVVDAWLEALADNGRLLVPLTVELPGMLSGIGKGMMLRPARRTRTRALVHRAHLDELPVDGSAILARMIADSHVPRAVSRRTEHVFYLVMAVAAIATAFLGFARTYFLRPYFQTTSLSALLRIHGAIFTSWLVLFLAQTTLVATRRTDIHRKLGWIGAALAALMVVVTLKAAVTAVHAAVVCCDADAARKFFAVPIADIIVFAVLVGAAIVSRRQLAEHKRLMLLATLTILDAATARWPIGFVQASKWGYYVAADALVLGAVAYDYALHKRIARAFLWGVPVIIGAQIAREVIGATAVWKSFARLIVG